MQSVNLFLAVFSAIACFQTLTMPYVSYGKGNPLVSWWCRQISWDCEQLLFALPGLPKQKEHIQKLEPAIYDGRRCAILTRPLS